MGYKEGTSKQQKMLRCKGSVEMKNTDTYKEVKTFTYPEIIIRVHIPDLSDDERKRRMKIIEKAAAALIIGSENKCG